MMYGAVGVAAARRVTRPTASWAEVFTSAGVSTVAALFFGLFTAVAVANLVSVCGISGGTPTKTPSGCSNLVAGTSGVFPDYGSAPQILGIAAILSIGRYVISLLFSKYSPDTLSWEYTTMAAIYDRFLGGNQSATYYNFLRDTVAPFFGYALGYLLSIFIFTGIFGSGGEYSLAAGSAYSVNGYGLGRAAQSVDVTAFTGWSNIFYAVVFLAIKYQAFLWIRHITWFNPMDMNKKAMNKALSIRASLYGVVDFVSLAVLLKRFGPLGYVTRDVLQQLMVGWNDVDVAVADAESDNPDQVGNTLNEWNLLLFLPVCSLVVTLVVFLLFRFTLWEDAITKRNKASGVPQPDLLNPGTFQAKEQMHQPLVTQSRVMRE